MRRDLSASQVSTPLVYDELSTALSAVLGGSPFLLPVSPVATDLVAKYFRTLGDTNRLRILQLLRDLGELRVGELVERTGLTQPNVSNHLACLRWCGFVTARRDHRVAYYSLADERVEQLLEIGHALLADNAEHAPIDRLLLKRG